MRKTKREPNRHRVDLGEGGRRHLAAVDSRRNKTGRGTSRRRRPSIPLQSSARNKNRQGTSMVGKPLLEPLRRSLERGERSREERERGTSMPERTKACRQVVTTMTMVYVFRETSLIGTTIETGFKLRHVWWAKPPD